MKRWFCGLAFVLACATSQEDPASLRRDALTLQSVLAGDRSPALMVDVERAVSARKPVHAASMIGDTVLPEVNAQIGRVRSTELTTVGARKIQLRLIDALEQRKQGLTDYRSVLSTGTLDAPEVIAALRVQRDAESALLAVDEELHALRPVLGPQK